MPIMEKRLLILTQKVDKSDPILGFFHGWIERFAAELESVTVVCLEEGEHDLPDNVRVLSLGKEEGRSRLKYLKHFFSYIWKLQDEYDTVFVHMNQEYVILGGPVWRALGKKVLFWRNHPHGNLFTRIAVSLVDRVYCTSSHSYTAKFGKTKLMPAGIDTEVFKKTELSRQIPRSVLYLGRISRVKRPDVLIDAIEELWERDIDVKVSVVGDPTPESRGYYRSIRETSKRMEESGHVRFFDAVQPVAAPELYNSHQIFVNLTKTGSFDKTILEAMACERLVVISNPSLERLIPPEYREHVFFQENDPEDLAKKLKKALALPESKKREMGKAFRGMIVQNQSLEKLVGKLLEDIKHRTND